MAAPAGRPGPSAARPTDGFQTTDRPTCLTSARKWLDIPYAPTSAAQRLDIYLPEAGDGPVPGHVYTHGGAFAIGDKRDLHVLSYLRGLERGYAVVSVNYRSERRGHLPGRPAGREGGRPLAAGPWQ